MYTISFIVPPIMHSKVFPVEDYTGKDFVLRTAWLEAEFSGSTGLLRSVALGNSTRVDVELDFVTYGTRSSSEKSGAYLFLPDREARSVFPALGKPAVTVITGPLVSTAEA